MEEAATVTPAALILVVVLCMLLGAMALVPYCFAMGQRKLQIAQAISVGLFATMALTHLLVEAQEYFEVDEHEHEHEHADTGACSSSSAPTSTGSSRAPTCLGHIHAFPTASALCISTLLVLLALEELAALLTPGSRAHTKRATSHDALMHHSDESDDASGGGAHTPGVAAAEVCAEHAAAHSVADATTLKARLSNTVLFGALSLHSVIAGAALGVEDCFFAFLTTALAILGHKGIEALALGAAYKQSASPLRRAALPIALFTLAVPCGALAGYLLRLTAAADVRAAISGVALSMAAGAFLFVALVETLPKLKHVPARIRLPSIFFGVALALLLTQVSKLGTVV